MMSRRQGTAMAGVSGFFSIQILERYVLVELLKVFALALAAMTVMLALGSSVQFLQGQSVSLITLVAAFPFLLPSVMNYTLPVAVLFATSLTYGRLAADNEIMAMQLTGVYLLRIVNPAILVGLLLSIVALGINSELIPKSRDHLQRLALANIETLLASQLKERSIQIPRARITFDSYDRRTWLLRGVTIYEGGSSPTQKLVAATARIEFDPENDQICLLLKDGTITLYRNGVEDISGPVRFTEQKMYISLKAIQRLQKTLKSMTLSELREMLPVVGSRTSYIQGVKVPSRAEVRTQIQKRLAMSFACLAFVFLGVPFGILFKGGHLLSAFFISCITVFLFYYPLNLAGEALGKKGLVSPTISMWAANVIMVVAGTVLLCRLFKR